MLPSTLKLLSFIKDEQQALTFATLMEICAIITASLLMCDPVGLQRWVAKVLSEQENISEMIKELNATSSTTISKQLSDLLGIDVQLDED